MIKDLKLGFRLLRTTFRHEKVGPTILYCFAFIGLIMEIIGDTYTVALGSCYLGLTAMLSGSLINTISLTGFGASSTLHRRISTKVIPAMTALSTVALYTLFVLIRLGKIFFSIGFFRSDNRDICSIGIIIGAMFISVCVIFGAIGDKCLVPAVIFLTLGLMVCIGGSVSTTLLYDRFGPWNVSLPACLLIGTGVVVLSIIVQTVLFRLLYYKDNTKYRSSVTGVRAQ